MAKVSQSGSGKAWEYGLASAAADIFSVPLVANSSCSAAQIAYDAIDEQERMRINNAAKEAIEFLRAHDKSLNNTVGVVMQSDMRGGEGDVRDVIIQTKKGKQGKDVGISAKHRHKAVKHSRLSPGIDFGYKWYGQTCSEEYRRSVASIWSELSAVRDEGKMWRDIPNKAQTIYAPVIRAFIREVRSAPAEKLLRYMLGKYDFYKIMKENGDVVLESFNLGGSLDWGQRPPMPLRIVDVEQTEAATAVIIFDKGWSLSFRLHNAESKATPSMKFDINLVGAPSQSSHTISYR